MSTYAESKEYCSKQIDMWLAEYHGLCGAATSFRTPPPYSKDPEIQAAYVRGFERGRVQLAIEKQEVPA